MSNNLSCPTVPPLYRVPFLFAGSRAGAEYVTWGFLRQYLESARRRWGAIVKALNQAVKRNAERFPEDFMFRLTKEEKSELVTNCDRFSRLKHSTVFPCAFTEQGVAMLSSVLNSARAVQVNVAIMRAFVQLRGMLASHAELSKKLSALEQKYDAQFKVVFEAIRELMEPPKKERRKIGF